MRPLDESGLRAVLHGQTGRVLPRTAMTRIAELSGGNPFYALELARGLDADADPLQPLPVPESLEEHPRARVGGLPEETREALALAAALGAPAETLLERAGVAPAALEPALAAGVVEREGGAIRFTHPLLAAGVYPREGAARRRLHARLAAVVDDPLQRARHLALSCEAPDAEVAATLDTMVVPALERGAAATAAELAEHALRLTPPEESDARTRRAVAAARAHHASGEWTDARAMLGDLLVEVEEGPARAEALMVLAELESLDRSVALLERRSARPGPTVPSRPRCAVVSPGRRGSRPGSSMRRRRSSSRPRSTTRC
jgi:hypothetical protein